ncbi:hypothetical protein PPERSA_08502 [Pseudocohnilembus persalinus]|uniref:C2H2-type domain-containing protein n=1 Tax=Pseudocohnilembus persalinus TaxID=266149 RepID=A0A0V0R6K1_PSEPJ|nr:hypothetical protein PPERSA_08502 [Pseudocohnilembus persalinus]|eukprot:KRX10099.1 hypothetical protein PPERSA_08502 [Pseudocohnilembus persalinus]
MEQQQQKQQQQNNNNNSSDNENDDGEEGEDQSSRDNDNQDDTDKNNKKGKPKKMFINLNFYLMVWCTFNNCGKSYSHTSGIRHHQREKHGQYNPDYYKKVDQSKSMEKRGRPKLQIKKEIQQINLQGFFQKLSEQEEESEKINPGRKQVKYQDKMMSFLLEKNIKFVLAVITEFGDPIIHKCRNNLFIEDWENYQDDPWKQGGEKEVDWDRFFEGKYGENLIDLDQYGNSINNENVQFIKGGSEQERIRMKEFLTRILSDIKMSIYMEFVKLFCQAWNYKFNRQPSMDENEIIQMLQNSSNKLDMFEKSKDKEEYLEINRNQFIQYLIHATFAYIFNQKNRYYDEYFGYVVSNN